MNTAEVEKLFKKPGEKRYEYFVKAAAENEEVFGLSDEEGWALLGDDEDSDILPLFPSFETAEAFRRVAGYTEYTVETLDVNELMEWLDEMQTDEILVAVFPNPDLNGAVVEAQHLKADLQTEFDKEVE